MASAAQMKAVAEEAAAMRRRRESRGAEARRARQTQPVTTAEVEQATAMARTEQQEGNIRFIPGSLIVTHLNACFTLV